MKNKKILLLVVGVICLVAVMLLVRGNKKVGPVLTSESAGVTTSFEKRDLARKQYQEWSEQPHHQPQTEAV